MVVSEAKPVVALDTLYEQDTTTGGSGGWYGADNAIIFKAISTHTVTGAQLYLTSSATAGTGYFYLREVNTTTMLPMGDNLGGTVSFSWTSGSGWKGSGTNYIGTVYKDKVYALIFHISSGNPLAYNHYPTAPYGYRYSTDGGVTWLGSYTWDWCYKIYGTEVALSFPTIDETTNVQGEDVTLYTDLYYTITPSGYFHSIDYGNGTYFNTTWTAFESAPYWANYTFPLTQDVGTEINWKVYANSSLGVWYVSPLQTFTVNTRVSFYFNDGGYVFVDSNLIENGTVITYSSLQNIPLLAASFSGYTIANFSFSGVAYEGYSSVNPFVFNSSRSVVLWCYFKTVGEGGAAPYAEAFFTYYPTLLTYNQPCTFDATETVSSSAVVEYSWDFGDGNVTAGFYATIVHVYAAEGNYTVTLTITTDDGTDMITQIVTVLSSLNQRSYSVALIFLVVGVLFGLMFLLFTIRRANSGMRG